MRITLTLPEISQIVVDRLATDGQLNGDESANVTFIHDSYNPENSTMIIEQ